MQNYPKPLPVPDNVSAEFWEAASRHRLLIQRCLDCDARQSFPQSCCRECLSENIEWLETKGTGKIYSFTIVHRAPSLAFEEDVPYTVALVELDEGVRMISNIVEVEPQEVRVGMPVEVTFDDVGPTISLPKFRPSDAS